MTKEGDRHKELAAMPGTAWVFRQALARTRSIALFFLFLTFLAMPVVLLIIGRQNYFDLTSYMPDSLYMDGEIYANPVLFPLHLITSLITVASVYLMSGAQFRYLFQMKTVDSEVSLPLRSGQQFLGRLLALMTSLALILTLNAAFTGLIFYQWDLFSHFLDYLRLYLSMAGAAFQLLTFSLVWYTLSGTLFDAILLNLGLQMAWFFSILNVLSMSGRLGSPPSSLLWLLTPAAGFITDFIWIRPLAQDLIPLVFWLVLSWFFFRRRPSERAGIRNGQLAWHRLLQPLFALFGGVSLGRFVYLLFDDLTPIFQSPAFYLGLLAGSLLGQFVSSVVSGKALRKSPWIHELLSSLAGLLLFGILTVLVHLCMTPPVNPW